MTDAELINFFNWLVENKIATTGFNADNLVHDYHYEQKFLICEGAYDVPDADVPSDEAVETEIRTEEETKEREAYLDSLAEQDGVTRE